MSMQPLAADLSQLADRLHTDLIQPHDVPTSTIRTASSAYLDELERALFVTDADRPMAADARERFRGLWGAYRLSRHVASDDPSMLFAILRHAGGEVASEAAHIRLRVVLELIAVEAARDAALAH